MIGRLTGQYGGTLKDGSVLVDVSGVGYTVRVPGSALSLTLERGEPLSLFIHTAVRDDAIDLYGFPTENGLSFFKLLTSVSGVGPKTALSILNVADVESLKRTVAAGDATVLTKVYGLGKKSAERIVVELRDKLAREGSEAGVESATADIEVLEALQALGYSASEARNALQSADGSADMSENVKEKLARALKYLGTPSQKTV